MPPFKHAVCPQLTYPKNERKQNSPPPMAGPGQPRTGYRLKPREAWSRQEGEFPRLAPILPLESTPSLAFRSRGKPFRFLPGNNSDDCWISPYSGRGRVSLAGCGAESVRGSSESRMSLRSSSSLFKQPASHYRPRRPPDRFRSFNPLMVCAGRTACAPSRVGQGPSQ